MAIFKGQTEVRLEVNTGIDFTDNSPIDYQICYIKPDGTKGSWEASPVSGSESDGIMFIDFSDTIFFDQIGYWTLYASLTFLDDRIATGTRILYLVNE